MPDSFSYTGFLSNIEVVSRESVFLSTSELTWSISQKYFLRPKRYWRKSSHPTLNPIKLWFNYVLNMHLINLPYCYIIICVICFRPDIIISWCMLMYLLLSSARSAPIFNPHLKMRKLRHRIIEHFPSQMTGKIDSSALACIYFTTTLLLFLYCMQNFHEIRKVRRMSP